MPSGENKTTFPFLSGALIARQNDLFIAMGLRTKCRDVVSVLSHLDRSVSLPGVQEDGGRVAFISSPLFSVYVAHHMESGERTVGPDSETGDGGGSTPSYG